MGKILSLKHGNFIRFFPFITGVVVTQFYHLAIFFDHGNSPLTWPDDPQSRSHPTMRRYIPPKAQGLITMRLTFFDHKTCPWPIYNTEILPFCGCMVLAYGLVLQRWQGWTHLQVSNLFSAWWLGTNWPAQPTKVSQAQWQNILCWKAMMIFNSILGRLVLHTLFSWGKSAGHRGQPPNRSTIFVGLVP